MLGSLYSRRFIDDKKMTFSRDRQDRYIVDNIFGGKMNGYFLDIGASDGIDENNTVLLERYYDWDGICCECDPRDITKLRKERQCNIVTSPVFRKTGELINFELHSANHLSSIEGCQVEKYRNNSSGVVCMATISLVDCLKKFNAPKNIDYMSLDTEGAEYEILSTFDFENYKINYIALEHNFQEPKRTKIRQLLESKGYAYHRSLVCDDDYILKEFAISRNISIN
jgi:FkbM family methyltransferase